MSRDTLSGYKSPIQTHECVLERRANAGLLAAHREFRGSWRAVCLFCHFTGEWSGRETASGHREHHEAWAALDPGRRDTSARSAESLAVLRCSIAGDVSRLLTEASCRAARHLHDDNGRLSCSCGQLAEVAQAAAERLSSETADADVSRIRIRRLAIDHLAAFEAAVASERPYLSTLSGPRSAIDPVLDRLEQAGHVVRRHPSASPDGHSSQGERLSLWQSTASPSDIGDCPGVEVTAAKE
jgi:hypothetical protein